MESFSTSTELHNSCVGIKLFLIAFDFFFVVYYFSLLGQNTCNESENKAVLLYLFCCTEDQIQRPSTG
jgi:hypothetical protein